MILYDGDGFRRVALHERAGRVRRLTGSRSDCSTARSSLYRLAETRQLVHIADMVLGAGFVEKPIR